MTGRYAAYEELRPLGEAKHVPDDTGSSSGSEPRRQRSSGVDTGSRSYFGDSLFEEIDEIVRNCGPHQGPLLRTTKDTMLM